MIPKIIHFCWLSNDPYPKDIQRCIDSWADKLPDYEIMHWNFDIFDIKKSQWVKEAFEAKKYAFAADYIRLYALYHYGGIYLDSDVEVLKTFDDLLDRPYFLCEENSPRRLIEAAVMGAEKKSEWIGHCLNYYADRSFAQKDGSYDTKPLPDIITHILQEYYELNYIEGLGDIEDKEKINILPVDYFSPKKWDDATVYNVTTNTYCIHHFCGSWLPTKYRMKLKLKRFIQKRFGNRFFKI